MKTTDMNAGRQATRAFDVIYAVMHDSDCLEGIAGIDSAQCLESLP